MLRSHLHSVLGLSKPAFACIALYALIAMVRAEEAPRAPSQQMHALIEQYPRDTAPYFPFTASDNGARKYDSVFANDLSDEYRSGLKALCNRYLADLRSIERPALVRQEQLTYDLFERRLNTCVENFDYPYHLLPVNQAGGWVTGFPVIGAGKGSHPFKTVRNYEDFLKRIDGFVIWIDTAIANMRTGIAQGITQPRDLMLKVVAQMDAHIVDTPQKSMFYEPLTRFPDDFDDATKSALTAQYEAAIRTRIIPAYRKLRAFIQDEYLPACRTSHGLRGLPGGDAMYRRAVRLSTTTDLTPEEIHAIGIAEVNRIHAQIRVLNDEIKAAKDKPLAKHSDVDSLLNGYRALRATVDSALPLLFGRLPKYDYEIRAIEAYREQSMSSSYVFPSMDGKRPGVFYLNASSIRSASGSDVVSRSLLLHEAMPGHHFQVALQRENKELPLFRRQLWYSAFGEGWGLYAEGLGEELGLYDNPHDRLAMLELELLRAARLVVDVGLHDKGWSRQQAIDYLVQTARSNKDNAEREVERYMAWPGQALSYKIGHLKILDIRKRAEARLGKAFDIRAFHDELLRDGAIPLDILDRKMDAWIAAWEQQ